MATRLKKAFAIIIGATFFMMIIGPIASLMSWLTGLIVAVIIVPAIVGFAVLWSVTHAKEDGKGLLEHTGITPEEWSEQSDPDDFEGEDD